MREIKFEYCLKDNYTKEIVKIINTLEELEKGGVEEKYTILWRREFTGLKDKNGKDIYEGDILQYTDHRGDHIRKSSRYDGNINGWVGVIEWTQGCGWDLNKTNNHNKEMLKRKKGEIYNKTAPYVYNNGNILHTNPEVIGNIYENPNLLKNE